MKISIQTKLIALCILLVLLTTISISTTYYVLTKRDKRQESQQRIQIAFDIILSNFENRFNTSLQSAQEFLLNDTLQVTTSLYARDAERVGLISFISNNLAKTAGELKRFGNVSSAQRVVLYGANKRLLTAYQLREDQETTGVYVLLPDGTEAYLPVDDDPSQLTSMLFGRIPIPDTALPESVPAYYEEEIPDTITANLFTEGQKLGIRIMAPITYQDQITGILLIDLYYTQRMIEEYASLSKTEINFFVRKQFSTGTLPIESDFVPHGGEHVFFCEDIMPKEKEIAVFPVKLGKDDYYQGQCMLKGEQGMIGAITVSLSQEIEQKQTRKIFSAIFSISLLVFAIAVVLSVIFSRKLIRPVRVIATLIHRIAYGDLTGIFTGQDSNANFPEKASQNMSEAQVHRILEENLARNDEIAMLTHAFYEMSAYLRDMAAIANTISRGEITQTITPRSEQDTLGLAFQNMLIYIQNITEVTKALAEGDLLVDVQPKTDQDILNHSLRKMIMYIQRVADVAETISEGNLKVQVQPKSEHDMLNQALKKMVEYIQQVADIAEKVSNNNLQIAVTPQSDQDILSISLQRMVSNLQRTHARIEHSMTEIEQQNWLKTGQAELNDVMRGEQEPIVLAKNIIAYLAQYVQAQVGALYLMDDSNGQPSLQLTASYAYTKRDANRVIFAIGEGLVGQAAMEKECLLYTDLPDDYITISTEAGHIAPRSVLVAPLIYEQNVKGVIELGTTQEFTESQLEFLKEVTENIAIAVHTAQARVKMQSLLDVFQQSGKPFQPEQFVPEEL